VAVSSLFFTPGQYTSHMTTLFTYQTPTRYALLAAQNGCLMSTIALLQYFVLGSFSREQAFAL